MEQINNKISVGISTQSVELKIQKEVHSLTAFETAKFLEVLYPIAKKQMPNECPMCDKTCIYCSGADRDTCLTCGIECHECYSCPAAEERYDNKREFETAKAKARSEHRIIQLGSKSSIAIEVGKDEKVSIHIAGQTRHLTKTAKKRLLEALKYVEMEGDE